jgi:hypothetical protein
MLWLAVSAAALLGGFVLTRDFVRRRLRFVDAIQRPSAPVIAGAAAAVVAAPVALLPIATLGTAIAFGVGVAGGVASGRSAPPQLPPGN